ncbi:phosphodiester glycosidase family protein [Laspinema olomoucense]|uniref:phosphodiester glycosidase family protein n=1 Tax=Laspinema olomoucense TaxID=3231600 RepID=UPI0021BAD04D|nr:phosphodiester glycosidase family protein [Laspinema sp. D3c]MCT7995448.1 phosphodiester glycosidase family protein [Laspinema sp. D3c]
MVRQRPEIMLLSLLLHVAEGDRLIQLPDTRFSIPGKLRKRGPGFAVSVLCAVALSLMGSAVGNATPVVSSSGPEAKTRTLKGGALLTKPAYAGYKRKPTVQTRMEDDLDVGFSPVAQGDRHRVIRQGTELSWNGQGRSLSWIAGSSDGNPTQIRYGLTDTDLMQQMGVELLNTDDAQIQPVRWFSDPELQPLNLPVVWSQGRRYLDITPLAEEMGWQLRESGQILEVSSPGATVEEIEQQEEPWGDRIVLDLNGTPLFTVTSTPIEPTPQDEDPNPDGVQDSGPAALPLQEFVITLDATITPELLNARAIAKENLTTATDGASPGNKTIALTLGQTGFAGLMETSGDRTTLRFQIPQMWRPRVWTDRNPNRLIIDIQPDVVTERNILWASGVRWRQQLIEVADSRFPVVWLELNHRNASNTVLKPITANPGLPGIAELSQIADRLGANAAINGGFFNRNNQLPLGAIREDGRWLSSPILNRGAIAWNDAGSAIIGRLSLEETLTTAQGEALPILFLNSGYVKAGISRYTPEWGETYTTLIDNEIIVVVEGGKVTQHLQGEKAGESTFAIPKTGFLLTLRSFASALPRLPIGTSVLINRVTVPSYFEVYPHILGAGPVLLNNNWIVLDPEAEQFNQNFIEGKASRSAIGQTEDGRLVIAIAHHRTNGPGPTLTEMAQIMQQLGSVNALNLDGGGSTTLFLGGQLLEHPPRIIPRIHNGLGIFLQSE